VGVTTRAGRSPEPLDTFGLSHTADTYAFTNGNERPWANRTGAEAIRPRLQHDLMIGAPGAIGRHGDCRIKDCWELRPPPLRLAEGFGSATDESARRPGSDLA
jgi:hypothetical protein